MSAVGGTRRPVTVVVPLYDDLKGIQQCVESVLHHVDLDFDRIILSNDRGPRHDEVEALVLRLIKSHPEVTYLSNEVNLGFVGNCNRVVLEYDTTGNDVLLLNSDTIVTAGFLDEMAEVLALSPSNGVITARSNNATLASIPDRRRLPRQPRTIDHSARVHAAVVDLLPRYTIAPVAMGFCFLIRRDLIDRYGLFDEAFAPGYGEENDFCLRVNQRGYASVLANRALVFHTGSTSFSGDRGPRLRFGHEKLLIERYPFYVGALGYFYQRGRDPVDTFADAFDRGDDVIRLAIDLVQESTDAVLRDIEDFVHRLGRGVVVTLITPKEVLAQARELVPSALITAQSRVDSLYDVALALGPIYDLARLVRLNELAPRWILIDDGPARNSTWSQRVDYHRIEAVERIAQRFADRWIVIDDNEAAARAVIEVAEREIDPAHLRLRWTWLVDAGLASGILGYPLRPSRGRRLALWIGAKSPRASRFLRGVLNR
ncbi:glycosyltransferase family 2 protein [Frondihabitans sp. 4ASC-45]|uniref:glycosyltransferase family 2 protein n=1 Tax=Frondihabitans sp. 4ASC-45 TaxID=3111636 RepID=UPI003C22125D